MMQPLSRGPPSFSFGSSRERQHRAVGTKSRRYARVFKRDIFPMVACERHLDRSSPLLARATGAAVDGDAVAGDAIDGFSRLKVLEAFEVVAAPAARRIGSSQRRCRNDREAESRRSSHRPCRSI